MKDLALHLPLAGLDRSSSSSPTSSPRHRPNSPHASGLSHSPGDDSAPQVTSASTNPTPSSSTIIQDRKRNFGPLHQACKQGDLVAIHGLLLSAISPASASPEEVGEPAGGDFAGWLPIHLLLASRALSPLAAHPPEIPLLPLLSTLLQSPTKGASTISLPSSPSLSTRKLQENADVVAFVESIHRISGERQERTGHDAASSRRQPRLCALHHSPPPHPRGRPHHHRQVRSSSSSLRRHVC